MAMIGWGVKFLRSPRKIGSVAPSSPFLAKLMTRGIAPHARVLELGSGSGAITAHILKKLRAPAQLTMVEADAEFADMCARRFPGAAVHNADAEDVLRSETATFDAVLSGIPFAAMDRGKRLRIFRLVRDRLAPGGAFVMFQYSLTTRGELRDVFGAVETYFTPWNLPPAFVYVCTV